MKKIFSTTALLSGAMLLASTALADKDENYQRDPHRAEVTVYGKDVTIALSGRIQHDAVLAQPKSSIHLDAQAGPFAAATGGTGFIFGAKHGGWTLQNTNSRFGVTAEGASDTGLIYNAYVEFDNASTTGGSSSNVRIARTCFEKSKWGKICVGQMDGPEDAITGGSTVMPTDGHDMRWHSYVIRPVGVDANPADIIGDTSKATKLVYMSPVISGVQVGLSYVPQAGHRNQDTNGIQNNGAGFITNMAPVNGSPYTAKAKKVWSAYVTYKGDFNGLGVQLDAATIRGDVHGYIKTENVKALEGWKVAANFKYANFTLGTSYKTNGKSALTATQRGNGQKGAKGYDVAVVYHTGPWETGVCYYTGDRKHGYTAVATGVAANAFPNFAAFSSETVSGGTAIQSGTAVKAKSTFWTAGASYKVTEGLTFRGQWGMYDEKSGIVGANVQTSKQSPGHDRKGQIWMVGSKIAF